MAGLFQEASVHMYGTRIDGVWAKRKAHTHAEALWKMDLCASMGINTTTDDEWEYACAVLCAVDSCAG